MTGAFSHRLNGLEPDNPLALLTLLGLLRCLEAADRNRAEMRKLLPRAAWDVDTPPLRPKLFLSRNVTQQEVTETAAEGLEMLAAIHHFDGHADLNFSRADCRKLLETETASALPNSRDRADLFAALMTDAAIKDEKTGIIDATPLCSLLGQGHQHFLDRLAHVPRQAAPPPRGKGKKAVCLSASDCLAEALFQPWHRNDPTFSFRWDPEEDVRYALMAGDPTDAAYKPGTQHGANRLAAVGLAALTVVPQARGRRVRTALSGGAFGTDGFSLAWPIWRDPASLCAIRALIVHPELRKPGALRHLGVNQVMIARRVSVGRFINFTRARPTSS
jgi:hypothetical protein